MPDLTPLPVLPTACNSITRPKTFVADADATFAALPALVTAWNVNVPVFNTNLTLIASSVLAAAESQSAAAASAALAGTHAGTATTKAGEASASALTAAQRLADIEALYDTFDDRYLGVKAVDPVVDNDGNPLQPGAMYVNSASGFLRAFNGAGWVQGISALAGVESLNGLQGPLTLKTVGGTSLIGGGNVDVPTDVVGQIKHSYNHPGAGWLECNGAVYLQSSYASLYAALGLLPNMSGYRNQSNMAYFAGDFSFALDVPEQVTPVVNTGTALVFIATRYSSSSAAVCYRSTNGGTTWSSASIASAVGSRISKLAYGNGRLIAASGYGGQATYLTSDDHGVTWTGRSFGAVYTTYDVVYGGGKWVHNSGNYSSDGTTWTAGTGLGLYQLAYNGTTWVGISGSVYTSPDGINWTAVSGITIDPAGYDYHRKSLIYANGAFWVIANYQQSGASTGEFARSWQLLRSTDGQNWTVVAAPMRYMDNLANIQIGSTFDVYSTGQMPHLFSGVGMIGVSVGHPNGKVSNYVTKDLITWEVLHQDYSAEYVSDSNIYPPPFVINGDRFGMVIWRNNGGTRYARVHREMKPRITYSTSTQFAVPHIVPGADGRKAYIKA